VLEAGTAWETKAGTRRNLRHADASVEILDGSRGLVLGVVCS
jgi:hypothetical protein